MQLSFRQKEQFFHELAQLSRSGVTLIDSLNMLSRSRGKLGRCAARVREEVQTVGGVCRAFERTGFSSSDSAVIEAGEHSGRLEQVFQELSAYYAQLADARRMVIARSLYPLFILHFGVLALALPFALINNGGWKAFLANVVPVLLGFYLALIAAAVLWGAIRKAMAASAAAAQVFSAIPILGGFLSDWTAWKYAAVLSLYVRAGGGLLNAFRSAAQACGNARLRGATLSVLRKVQGGEGLSAAFRQESGIPEFLDRAIEVGDHSGRLDEETRRAAEIYKDKTLFRLEQLAHWLPRLVYFAVVLLTAWRIFVMVSSVASAVDSALNIES